MLFPQKSQYALRAVFELAKRVGQGPVKIAAIAETQKIPTRFLEVILNELKQGGFVESVRGKDGGYLMARVPETFTVGELMRFVQGPLVAVECRGGKGKCPLYGECVFDPMWQRVNGAISGVFDGTTFQDLVEEDARLHANVLAEYVI